jgi:hypothetical protein
VVERSELRLKKESVRQNLCILVVVSICTDFARLEYLTPQCFFKQNTWCLVPILPAWQCWHYVLSSGQKKKDNLNRGNHSPVSGKREKKEGLVHATQRDGPLKQVTHCVYHVYYRQVRQL